MTDIDAKKIEEFRDAVALAIHNARYAHPEHPREPDPFTDRGDREYAYRLADAAIRTLSSRVEEEKRAKEEAEAENARLARLVYVPGQWRCAKCKFTLIQANLNANDGTVTARDQPGDKCPNCDSPLWRVTERDAGNEMIDRAEEAFNAKRAAESRSAALARALEEAKEALDFYFVNFKWDKEDPDGVVRLRPTAELLEDKGQNADEAIRRARTILEAPNG